MASHRRISAALITALVLIAASVLAWTGGTAGATADSASGAGSAPGPSCPATDPGQVVSQRPGADTAMVPAGPTAVAVCEFNTVGYPGAGARNGLIGSGVSSDAATVAKLTTDLNALTEDQDYPVACPADAGNSLVAYFAYPDGVPNPVRLDLGGCDDTGNGHLTRLAIGTPVPADFTDVIAMGTPTPTGPTGTTGTTGTTGRLPLGPGPVVIAMITGTVQLCGGPAPGGCHTEIPTICGPPQGCVSADRVRILRNGSTVAVVKVTRGRFRTSLSPGGRLTVELLGDGRHVHGKVLQRKTVNAKNYATTKVTFHIDVP